jgi:acetylcholinesterase/cholinesterase
MASPGSANLFHAAIMESNPLGLPLHTIETSKALALLFAQNLNCSSSSEGEQHEWIEKLPVRVRNVLTQHNLLTAHAVPECLMNASIDNIIFAQTAAATHISLHVPLQVAMPWSPVVDGTIVPCQPIDCFEQKKIVNQVPIILGTTVEEARPFVYAARPDSGLPWYEYNPLLMELFGLKYFFGVNSDYPSNYSSDCRDTLSQLGTDYLFTCANRHIASVYTATTGAPAYLYLFDHVASFDFWSPLFTYCTGHNCHGEELPFVWQTETLAGSQPTPDERALSQNIATYWGNMGFTYSPNAGSSPPMSWPAFNFTDGTGPILRLTAPAAIVMPGYRADMCAHWDERGYHFD